MRDGKVVAIHQPNVFPWLGYFNKIVHADVFIILDNVQFQKTGGNWSNRVQIVVNGKAGWMTIPVDRTYHGVRLVREMLIDHGPWRSKLTHTLRHNYKRAPYFETVFPVLTELINNPADRLAEYNLTAIRALTEALRLDSAKILVGSSLKVNGKATELLIAMVKAVGGTAYFCGGRAGGYQEDETFGAEGVNLIYQDFQHPVYPQGNSTVFIPGLSIIDTLMQCGFPQTRQLIMSSPPPVSAQTNLRRPAATG